MPSTAGSVCKTERRKQPDNAKRRHSLSAAPPPYIFPSLSHLGLLGAASGITDSISSMGSRQIAATISDADVSLSAETVETLSSYPTISAVAPVISTSATVKKNGNTGSYSVVGITASYFEVQETDIQRGRQIVDSDVEWNTKVCVIGTEVATDMFGTWDAVGGTVVIGESVVNAAINSVENFLLQATRDEEAFSVSNQSDILDTMDDVTDTMSLLLAGIAAISLLGGIIGLVFSFAAIKIYGLISATAIGMNWGMGLAALAFCAVIGVVFGGYPAAKASRLQPIEALHTL